MESRRSRWRTMFTGAVALLLAAGTAGAQTTTPAPSGPAGKTPHKVPFDHAGTNESRAYSIHASDGELIQVEITNTCVEQFSYDTRMIKADGPPRVANESECAPKTKTLDIVHRREFGGYVVSIKRTSPGVVTVNGTALADVELVISVETRKWDVDVAGAFTTTWLTDPAFGLEMRVPAGSTDNVAKPFVVRDRDAEDEVRMGVGAFAHAYHTKHPWVALTFGLGINEANATTYFVGPTWRLGDAASFTAGYAWGSVKRLPAGTRFDQPVDAGILGNLGSHTDGDWFFGLSYKFIDVASALRKPFEPVKDKGADTGGAAGSKPDDDAEPEPDDDATPTAAIDMKEVEPTVAAICEDGKAVVTVSWTRPTGLPDAEKPSYAVLRSVKADCSESQPVATVAESTIAKDSSVAPNTAYSYRVRAGSVAGKESKCVKVTTGDCESPD